MVRTVCVVQFRERENRFLLRQRDARMHYILSGCLDRFSVLALVCVVKV